MTIQKKPFWLLHSLIFAGILFLSAGKLKAQVQQRPGGVTNPNYAWIAWLTPDNYSNGTWTNRIIGNISVGNFTSVNQKGNTSVLIPPILVNTGYNFQPSVLFTKGGGNSGSSNDQSRLVSANPLNVTDKNVTAIFVFKRKNDIATETLFSFNAYDNGDIGWFSTGNQNMRWNWNGNNLTTIVTTKEGMITLDNANGTGGLNAYLNGGVSVTGQSKGSRNFSSQLVISSNGTYGYGFYGTIQEIILLSAGAGGSHVDPVDLQKIHSYLAVKYGITLNNADNYLNSDGNPVWSKTAPANAGYNTEIFGIGRDDASGLNQKQSQNGNKTLTVFTGNTLETLNSQNTGIFADKQYLMIGSSGGNPVQQLTGVNAGDIYKNGSLVSSYSFNIQSPIYKAQLTGPLSSMTVNMQALSNDFLYALVSSNADFDPENTYIYSVNDRIAAVTIDTSYPYIKFIGFTPGPGGVSGGLRLWLRADDVASITIENLSLSDSKLNGYSDPVDDPNNVPGVSVWTDFVREKAYSYAAGPNNTAHLMPVYKSNSPEMNYHPAVRFWVNGSSSSTYLSNATNIFGASSLADGKHTAYFMLNSYQFNSTNAWTYPFTFGGTNINLTMPAPGYGVEQSSNQIVGRFRTVWAELRSSMNLFDLGTTSMLGYSTKTNHSGANNFVNFRFNGVDDVSTTQFNWSDLNFGNGSMLGGLYTHDRTMPGVISEVIIYDRSLDAGETELLESYLAIKYGVTLFPSNTVYGRFTYKFSNATVIWDGNIPTGNPFADFYNNIAAVIRDDKARLDNRHTHSTNVGSLLHLGVAGAVLSNDGNGVGRLENDLEAVVFGNNSETGSASITNGDECGDFTGRFNRKWLVHKVTKDDRPIELLVGAQNNMGTQIGNDPSSAEYYNVLTEGYDVSLIVAGSPADIDAGNYQAVIPMTYINGEHQCNYTFSENDTYITFGWKPNDKGCLGDADAIFTGSKTFDWTQWTSRTNISNAAGLTIPTIPFGSVDLGDNIEVTDTKVIYPANVRANTGYPRSVNTPVRGSLEVQRNGGNVNQDVVVKVTFNHPVVPEFSISGLNGYTSSFEEVEIYGECSGITYMPVLSYASAKNRNTTYLIRGNVATVTKRGTISASDKNGMVKVVFEGGVTSLTIKYRTKNRISAVRQHIFISPITLRMVPLPPPVNEDGMSFVKQVKEREMTTCEPVEYSFYIQNVNCDPKTISFSDTLPEKMKWDIHSIGLDAVSNELNPSLDPQIISTESGTREELLISDLVVPGSTILILKATAVFDDDAPTAAYSNRATIIYPRITESEPESKILQSLDRETLEPYTTFSTIYQQHLEKIELEVSYNRQTYKSDSEIEVTYTLTNANIDITDMFLNVDFNEEFTYVGGSFQVTQEEGQATVPIPVLVTPDPNSSGTLTIAGESIEGLDGFTLPTGKMVIKFRLKAPALDNVKDELDDEEQPTGNKAALDIAYEFFSTMDDPCATLATEGLHGKKVIPYSGRTHVISNKHITHRVTQ